MGSGDWFKTIISSKKAKDNCSKRIKGSSAPEKSNGFKWRHRSGKDFRNFANGATSGNPRLLGVPVEDIAATRIQTAFRAYMARKTLRRLKGIVRLQILTQGHHVKKQSSTTLNYLHSWSRIQDQIRARRLCMVTESRMKQKKLENQLKLEAKLNDLEVEWSGGSETMEEVLTRIHQREEAAVKRERAMAYAFSHQWRANSSQNQLLGAYEIGKANWGWSWMERWIAARPWESRVSVQSISPSKPQSKPANKTAKSMNSSTSKISVPVKPASTNGKANTKARRWSYPAAEKPLTKAEEVNAKKGQVVTPP